MTFKSLKIALHKSHFDCDSFNYLGFTFSNAQISIGNERIQGLLALPRPQSAKGILRFIGIVNYLSMFVPYLSDLVAPLYDLTCKNKTFNWTEKHEESFQKIKDIFRNKPILYLPQRD